jgi:hypothetical protein
VIEDAVALSWRRLAVEVLVQAWRDAHNQNGRRAARDLGLPEGVTLADDARQWLASEGARWLVMALDLEGEMGEEVLARLGG